MRANRQRVLSEVVLLSVMKEPEFRRMFRMHPDDVFDLLAKITPLLPPRRADSVPVSILLFATLRFLAGGSYLDIYPRFYISPGSFSSSVMLVIAAIDMTVDNIRFPDQAMVGAADSPKRLADMARLVELAAGFAKLSGTKFPGTVAAVDGLVLAIWRPPWDVSVVWPVACCLACCVLFGHFNVFFAC